VNQMGRGHERAGSPAADASSRAGSRASATRAALISVSCTPPQSADARSASASSPIRASAILLPKQFTPAPRPATPRSDPCARVVWYVPRECMAPALTLAAVLPAGHAGRPGRSTRMGWGHERAPGLVGGAWSRAGGIGIGGRVGMRRVRALQFKCYPGPPPSSALPAHRRNARRCTVYAAARRIAPAPSQMSPGTLSDLWLTRAVASACTRCRRASARANGGLRRRWFANCVAHSRRRWWWWRELLRWDGRGKYERKATEGCLRCSYQAEPTNASRSGEC
jgi:hypothetical protein